MYRLPACPRPVVAGKVVERFGDRREVRVSTARGCGPITLHEREPAVLDDDPTAWSDNQWLAGIFWHLTGSRPGVRLPLVRGVRHAPASVAVVKHHR